MTTNSAPTNDAAPPLLGIRGLEKRFPGVVALDDVSLDLAAGEVHGLIGQNGAGKSTLINILSGMLPADAGTVRLDGAPVTIRDPRHALSWARPLPTELTSPDPPPQNLVRARAVRGLLDAGGEGANAGGSRSPRVGHRAATIVAFQLASGR